MLNVDVGFRVLRPLVGLPGFAYFPDVQAPLKWHALSTNPEGSLFDRRIEQENGRSTKSVEKQKPIRKVEWADFVRKAVTTKGPKRLCHKVSAPFEPLIYYLSSVDKTGINDDEGLPVLLNRTRFSRVSHAS